MAAQLRGAFVWLDREGRVHAAPAEPSSPPRWLYAVERHRLRFVGHGARRCGGCGGTLEPLPSGEPAPVCPLCGRPE